MMTPHSATEPDVPTLRSGKYRHYKGNYYEVFFVARHSETLELLVCYRCLYGDFDYFVRPYDMFCEKVDVEGTSRPRFDYVGET
jgi:hypothetical protein